MIGTLDWRKRIAGVGLSLVILNPIYWFIGIRVAAYSHASDDAFGNMVVSGFFIGIASLVCALFGKGSQRLGMLAAAMVETFLWWFMAVGI